MLIFTIQAVSDHRAQESMRSDEIMIVGSRDADSCCI